MREGDCVTVSAAGRDAAKPWRVQLTNVFAVKAVEHGTVTEDPMGVIITPEAGSVSVTVVTESE